MLLPLFKRSDSWVGFKNTPFYFSIKVVKNQDISALSPLFSSQYVFYITKVGEYVQLLS